MSVSAVSSSSACSAGRTLLATASRSLRASTSSHWQPRQLLACSRYSTLTIRDDAFSNHSHSTSCSSAGPSSRRWLSSSPSLAASNTPARNSATQATPASSSHSSSGDGPAIYGKPHLTSAPDPKARFDMPRANLDEPPSPSPAQPPPASDPKSPATGKPVEKPRASKFRAQKAPITLTAPAVERLRALQTSPTDPRLIRISVRNKGCAGMSYHLEYVKPEEAGKFDERIQQDDVTVLIDSKALFSIIGSEMDWKEDRLSAKFVFNNPLAVSCGCGESFAVK